MKHSNLLKIREDGSEDRFVRHGPLKFANCAKATLLRVDVEPLERRVDDIKAERFQDLQNVKNVPISASYSKMDSWTLDSYSKGCEFESQHHLLDGHFFTFICCKNCNVGLKRRK